jgi:hypothetical protein
MFKTNTDQPEWSEIEACDTEIHHLWSQWQDGILCRQFQNADTTVKFHQVLVPRTLQRQFLEQVHAGLNAGHFGVQKKPSTDFNVLLTGGNGV